MANSDLNTERNTLLFRLRVFEVVQAARLLCGAYQDIE